MDLRQVAIGLGFLVVGAGQFLLSQSMVAQQSSFTPWPPVAMTPFSDFVASSGSFSTWWQGQNRSPRAGDRVIAVDGKPFLGMSSYLSRYWKKPGKQITMTFRGQTGEEWTGTWREQPCPNCGHIGPLWAVSIWGIAPFFCLGTAWLVVAQRPRSMLAWAFAGLMLSLSQLSLWPAFNERFELVGSPMGWVGWYRVPVLAGQAFLQSAWPAFLLLGAGEFRSLGWLGKSLVAAFFAMAGVEAGLAVAWSEDYRPWVGVYTVLAEHTTELALLGLVGVAGWVWTADRWLGVLAGCLTVAAGAALLSEPAALHAYEWAIYSDNSRRVEPILPAAVPSVEFVELLVVAGMLLAALLRAGRRVPLPLLGAWVLLVPLGMHLGVAFAGYPPFQAFPFVDNWLELMLTSAGGAVVLAGWWVTRRNN